ncbi:MULTISPECIES: heavy metal translocating P-type ATPase [Alphaproteobacteria]|jgi:Cd2+/Zn2+-exporting ATPase|uniref:P-type Zn(2+) transporter n=3 Tax=Pseudomonadota TaxID=1224 RepID=A0A927EDX7_9HYPH|nr:MULTISPECIES: heavy metal translocating P-type ATPase [Alphaproteobacteria]ODT32658.1 MAG: ATPase [Kaistia sp. SCN 65-12]MBD3848647.1 cadmium-translocating P-type ATPase [Bosea spartocytisi]MBN9255357.1 cadmium-translocating P-type ATPase [Mesorhizobium sp.]MCT4471679.1 heavy metal translocating P-type ATPase [Bosea spartocytisi]MDR7258088.1 Cd2+/Zn2+-exporting ATPase [Sphingomonas sp. BE270]
MTKHSQQSRYRVDGMDCASCAAKIDTAVRRVPGVEDVSVSATAGTMTVRHGDDEAVGPAITKTVTGLGYKLRLLTEHSIGDGGPKAVEACGCQGRSGPDAHAHDDARKSEGPEHRHHNGQNDGKASSAELHGHDHGPTNGPWWRSGKGRLTIASGIALIAAYAIGKLVPGFEPWIFTAAMLVGLVPIARRAIMAAIAGTPFSIEMLMTIAAVGAVAISASEEAATVVFLFLIGELLEGVAAGRARASIQSLTALLPKTALLEEGGKTREVPAEDLIVDSLILVRPGDRIPADGLIVSGESAIDEAPVTGESTPVRKGVDAIVFAGTVNGEAALRIRVTAAAADNTIARVVKLVEEAQESKAPTERFIDRFSRYYTPGVVVVAALVAVIPPLLFGGAWSEWIYKGLAILLIGCPCALVISTPAAIAASLSAGARRGLLLKGGAVLEKIGTITAAAFDKTGTLTEGKPQVTDIVGFGRPEADVLRLAAALETGSNHPLARAILERAASDNAAVPQITDAKAIGGKGITGTVDGSEVFFGSPHAAGDRTALTPDQIARIAAFNDDGKTVSVLLADGQVAGAIAMRDEPRVDAKAGLKALADAGIKTVMLTGDNRRTADAIGKQLGIEVHAELLPQDKQRVVGELKRQGFSVIKVGDGINDAPALAAADVGIAMGGSADVALETADAAVLHGRVGDVFAMIALSKRTMANIRQNIAIAIGLKAVFLVTTVVGITGLWPAILADTGATVLVTMNALRLLKVGQAQGS